MFQSIILMHFMKQLQEKENKRHHLAKSRQAYISRTALDHLNSKQRSGYVSSTKMYPFFTNTSPFDNASFADTVQNC